MKREEALHAAVCRYIKYQYPNVLFNTDLSGVRLTPGLAGKVKHLRSGKGYPDLVIYEPRGEYHGLFIELKAEGERIWKRNGDPSNPHIAQQETTMNALRARGYACAFCIGIDQAIEEINTYLRQKKFVNK